MAKQILVIGSLLTVLVATTIIVLSILDVITVHELGTTLGKTVSATAVLTAGALLAGAIVKIGKRA